VKIHQSITNFSSKKGTVLTIGTFDGFHIGHQKIVNQVIDVAQNHKLTSVVLTFFPHPRMVLQKDSNIKLIHTIDERVQVLSSTKLEHLIIQPFTTVFSRLSAAEFVSEVLVKQLNIKHIIIGYDHRFGKNRTATIADLKEFGELYGFEVQEISAQEIQEVSVSSTKIRKAIEQGDIAVANKYLGNPFQLSGVVVKGKGIGKTINYPTANIQIAEDYKIIPKNGIYIATAKVDGKSIFGMMNIGTNPTVNGNKKTIEINLFNFNADIYNQKIEVTVLKRMRDEQKFKSVTELQQQLQQDKQQALAYFENHI